MPADDGIIHIRSSWSGSDVDPPCDEPLTKADRTRRALIGDVQTVKSWSSAAWRVPPANALPTAASTLRSPQGWGVALLVAACVADLPLVYLLIRAEAPAMLVLAGGLLSIGLAWSGGFILEGKRLRLARGVATLGAASGAAAFAEPVREVGGAPFVLAGAFLAAAGVMLTWDRVPTPREMRRERG